MELYAHEQLGGCVNGFSEIGSISMSGAAGVPGTIVISGNFSHAQVHPWQRQRALQVQLGSLPTQKQVLIRTTRLCHFRPLVCLCDFPE